MEHPMSIDRLSSKGDNKEELFAVVNQDEHKKGNTKNVVLFKSANKIGIDRTNKIETYGLLNESESSLKQELEESDEKNCKLKERRDGNNHNNQLSIVMNVSQCQSNLISRIINLILPILTSLHQSISLNPYLRFTFFTLLFSYLFVCPVYPSANIRATEKAILDKIIGKGYDSRIRPSGNASVGKLGGDGPAMVYVNLLIRSISRIDDVVMVSLLCF